MYDLIRIMEDASDDAVYSFFEWTREKNPIKKKYWKLRSEVANRKFINATKIVIQRLERRKHAKNP